MDGSELIFVPLLVSPRPAMAKVAVVEMDGVNYWPHVNLTPLLSPLRLWVLCGYRRALLGLLPSCQDLKNLSSLSQGHKVSFSTESRKLCCHFSIGQIFKFY